MGPIGPRDVTNRSLRVCSHFHYVTFAQTLRSLPGLTSPFAMLTPTNPFLPHTRWKRKSFVTAGKTWLVNVMSGQGVTSGYKGLTVPPGSELWVK